MQASFPTAPKHPKEITQHGNTRVDNYFWMRYREDPEVLQYLHAESDYLEEVMQHTQSLQRGHIFGDEGPHQRR